jgi:hypothetical protein
MNPVWYAIVDESATDPWMNPGNISSWISPQLPSSGGCIHIETQLDGSEATAKQVYSGKFETVILVP